MNKKVIIIIAAAVVLLLVIGVVVTLLLLMGGDDTGNGGGGGKVEFIHEQITSSGDGAFPRVDGGKVYWLEGEYTDIVEYDIGTDTEKTIYTHDGKNETLTGLYVSDKEILVKIFYDDDDLDKWRTYLAIWNKGSGEMDPLDIEPFGLSIKFEYPYVHFNELGDGEEFSIDYYVYDISTDKKTKLPTDSWGDLDGDKFYCCDQETYEGPYTAQIYDIDTGSTETVMISSKSSLQILAAEGNCILVETEDTGPDAKTYIYTYDQATGDMAGVVVCRRA